jgi:hypothetical protein
MIDSGALAGRFTKGTIFPLWKSVPAASPDNKKIIPG